MTPKFWSVRRHVLDGPGSIYHNGQCESNVCLRSSHARLRSRGVAAFHFCVCALLRCRMTRPLLFVETSTGSIMI